MKRALMVALFAFAFGAALASAQEGPVVSSASFLEWDYAAGQEGVVSEFRVYLAGAPGIVPDGLSYTAQVAYPALTWAIVGDVGQYYAVCTAYTVGGVESGPSNEVAFYILDAPVNLRVADTAAAMGMTGGADSIRLALF